MNEDYKDQSQKSDYENLNSSGETMFSMEERELTVEVPKEEVAALAPGSLF